MTPAAPAEPTFVEVPALRQVPSERLGSLLADIESRLPPNSVYVNADNPQNWAHEGTHGINSLVRNQHGERKNAFYLFEGRAVVLSEPRFPLSAVVSLVPADFRDVLLSSDFEDSPLYVLDEWTAYTNGTLCGLDREFAGLPILPNDDDHSFGVGSAIKLCAYAAAVVQAVDRFDPQYAERDQLVAFVTWQTARVRETVEIARAKSRFFFSARTAALWQAFERHYPQR